MLLEKIKPNTLVWGKRLKDYHESKEGVKLLWEDGTYEDELFDVDLNLLDINEHDKFSC